MPRGQYPRKRRKPIEQPVDVLKERAANQVDQANVGRNSEGQPLMAARYVEKKVHKVIIKQEIIAHYSDGTTKHEVETFPAVYTEWE